MADEIVRNKLTNALEIAGVDVLRQTNEPSKVHYLFRVRYKKVWLDVLEYVLARAIGWDAHVCQQYFMRAGKLVYGWNMIFQPVGDLEEALDSASKLFTQAVDVVAKMEGDPLDAMGMIESFPLVGASPSRNAPIVRDPKTGVPIHRGGYPLGTGN